MIFLIILLFNALYDFRDIINHNKYANNYDYNKAVYLMGEQKFIENGFLLIKKDFFLSLNGYNPLTQ